MKHKRPDLYAIAGEIATEWKGGLGYNKLAAKYKCSPLTIQRVLESVLTWDEFRRICHQKMAANLFQAGTPRPDAAPIGTIRVRKRPGKRSPSWYREIKIADDRRDRNQNWLRLAVYRWEQAHGPVPPGHVVLCQDGDSMNDALENLVVVTRAEALAHARQRGNGFYDEKWHEAHRAAEERLSPKQKRERSRRMQKGRRRWIKECADRKRMARIREIIPVPACVTASMESGWWDNREDDDVYEEA